MSLTREQIQNENNTKSKPIYIRNTQNNQEIEIQIQLIETVGDLKRKIENIFGLEYGFLNGYFLRIKYKGQREGKLLDNDNTTLGQNHVKSYSTVMFGKTKNKGGKIFFLKS